MLFSVKFAKFLRIPFFTEYLLWLLLVLVTTRGLEQRLSYIREQLFTNCTLEISRLGKSSLIQEIRDLNPSVVTEIYIFLVNLEYFVNHKIEDLGQT